MHDLPPEFTPSQFKKIKIEKSKSIVFGTLEQLETSTILEFERVEMK